ncbi:unnamed protein product [Rhizopus stolonifer]
MHRSAFTAIGSANRMEDITTVFQQLGITMGDTQYRLLCDARESTNTIVHQLEMGSTRHNDERLSDPLEPMETSVSLSPVTSHTSLPPKTSVRTNFSDDHYARLAECDMVPISQNNYINYTDTGATTHDHSSQSKNRIGYVQEQPVAPFGLEHKHRRLQRHRFDDNAINVFLDPTLRPSARNYEPIQRRFLDWYEEYGLDTTYPDPSQIVNFIAYGHFHLH